MSSVFVFEFYRVVSDYYFDFLAWGEVNRLKHVAIAQVEVVQIEVARQVKGGEIVEPAGEPLQACALREVYCVEIIAVAVELLELGAALHSQRFKLVEAANQGLKAGRQIHVIDLVVTAVQVTKYGVFAEIFATQLPFPYTSFGTEAFQLGEVLYAVEIDDIVGAEVHGDDASGLGIADAFV